MEIILTESQYIKLLIEENLDNAQSEFEKSDSLIRKILKDVKLGHKLNFTMALTWGPIMGGLLRPVNDYVNNLDPTISSSDLSLILFGIMVTFFSSNEELLNKTLKLIKEKKLVTYFFSASRKAITLTANSNRGRMQIMAILAVISPPISWMRMAEYSIRPV
jgi:hypothetical protein